MNPKEDKIEARSSWNWCSSYATLAAANDRGRILINMDESFVPYFLTDKAGNIVKLSKRQQETMVPHAQNITRAQQRLGLTLVALMAQDAQIQKLLPQIMIIGAKNCSRRSFQHLVASLPPRHFLVRQKSKWINKAVLCYLMRSLAWHLREYMPLNEIVLLLDCCPVHYTPEVLLAARDAGIHLVLVPARLTWLLQPLDVYGFAVFKRHLRAKMLRLRIERPASPPTTEEWVTAISQTITELLTNRDWRHAFDGTGYGDTLANLSSYIRIHLGPTCPDELSGSFPTDDELALCFPRRTRNTHAELFRPPTPAPIPLPAPPPAALPPPVGAAAAPAVSPAPLVLLETAFTAARARPAPPAFVEFPAPKPAAKAKAKPKVAFAKAKAKPKPASHS